MSSPSNISRTILGLLFTPTILFATLSSVLAQQPFVTDDADVTPRGHIHLEVTNEFDLLPRSAFPNLKQNTLIVELDYGLFDNLEIGVAPPLITIINDRQVIRRTVSGPGDVNLSLKYNFLKEREGTIRPAMSVTMNLELPTGDVNRQLGSGLADLYLNGVLQKSFSKSTKLRLNGGFLFSGNETTGAIGIKSRGRVFTGGGSLVKEFTPKLQLGAELIGAVTKTIDLAKGQLQATLGGNYQWRDNVGFSFAVLSGKYAASPRVGMKLGFALDF
jgi:Putative MetA-pathway of phenol degradation